MTVERLTDWLLRRRSAPRERRRPAEPADMGTAFGMEWTLDQDAWPEPMPLVSGPGRAAGGRLKTGTDTD